MIWAAHLPVSVDRSWALWTIGMMRAEGRGIDEVDKLGVQQLQALLESSGRVCQGVQQDREAMAVCPDKREAARYKSVGQLPGPQH